MSTKAYESFSQKVTPQTEPIPGEAQVENNAGGFVYDIGKWAAFHRFLILGSEGGTYYTTEKTLTRDNALNTMACIAEDPERAIRTIVEVSDAGRAPKNDPAIFALALAASHTDPSKRALATAALPKVCRIPTHLFHFLSYLKGQRGMSRNLRTAISQWYARWDADHLAHELVKYQSRDGWANRDVLRVAHPKGKNLAALRWAVGASTDAREVKRLKGTRTDAYGATEGLPGVIQAFIEAQTATKTRLVELIHQYDLTREMVPTEMLASKEVWEALLAKMPLTAMLRNLGNMSKVGLLTPMSTASSTVVARLADAGAFKKARVHPVAVLIALKTYANGKGLKGSGAWSPVPAVVDALDAAFYLAFGAIEPTGKRILYGLDVSGSMSSACGGLPITCAEGAAATALVSAKTESQYYIMGFSNQFKDLGITPRMRLDDALRRTRDQNFGSTDCAQPMLWASKQKVDVDAFVVITDSETYAGRQGHPSQVLRAYRQQTGIAAKQVVIGMTATNFSIADPKDPLAVDVVGFDSAVPQAISEFIR